MPTGLDHRWSDLSAVRSRGPLNQLSDHPGGIRHGPTRPLVPVVTRSGGFADWISPCHICETLVPSLSFPEGDLPRHCGQSGPTSKIPPEKSTALFWASLVMSNHRYSFEGFTRLYSGSWQFSLLHRWLFSCRVIGISCATPSMRHSAYPSIQTRAWTSTSP